MPKQVLRLGNDYGRVGIVGPFGGRRPRPGTGEDRVEQTNANGTDLETGFND